MKLVSKFSLLLFISLSLINCNDNRTSLNTLEDSFFYVIGYDLGKEFNSAKVNVKPEEIINIVRDFTNGIYGQEINVTKKPNDWAYNSGLYYYNFFVNGQKNLITPNTEFNLIFSDGIKSALDIQEASIEVDTQSYKLIKARFLVTCYEKRVAILKEYGIFEGNVLSFYDKGHFIDDVCPECNPGTEDFIKNGNINSEWHLEILDYNSANLYSTYGPDRKYKSCLRMVGYQFDYLREEFAISPKEYSKFGASAKCMSAFFGKYHWQEAFGEMRFMNVKDKRLTMYSYPSL